MNTWHESDSSASPAPATRRSTLLPSPSAYLAQAHSAIGVVQSGARAAAAGADAAYELRPRYRPNDPALRLWGELSLPHAPDDVLDAMVVRVRGIADRDSERLLYDLGYSSIRSVAEFDERSGTLILMFVRRERAAVYARLATTLRYINRSAAPSPGTRRVTIETLDANGRAAVAGEIAIAVAETAEHARGTTLRAIATIGEMVRFSAAMRFMLFWWPHRLRAESPRAANGTREAANYVAGAADSAADEAFLGRTASGYRMFQAGPTQPARTRTRRDRGPPIRGRSGNVLHLADLFGSEIPHGFGVQLGKKRRAR